MTERSPPQHTPEPWDFVDGRFIVAGDPAGRFPEIYIAEVVIDDSEGRAAPEGQIEANGWLIATAPSLLAAGEAVVAAWKSRDLAAAVRHLAEICETARRVRDLADADLFICAYCGRQVDIENGVKNLDGELICDSCEAPRV